MYLFGLLDAANQHTLSSITQQEKDLAVLQAERESYKQAQGDLQTLAEKAYQPDNFFSKDITLSSLGL